MRKKMKIVIDYIKDFGDKEKERVVFRINQPTNLGLYVIAESVKVGDTSISSFIKNVYWLPDQELKTGDLVVLYTKKGEKRSVLNEDGSTTYFYYWGLGDTLSSEDKSCVVLFETSWMFKEAHLNSDETKDATSDVVQ